MRKADIFNRISLILNSGMVLLSIIGIILIFTLSDASTLGWLSLKYFTVLSNLFAGGMALVLVIYQLLLLLGKTDHIPLPWMICKYLSVCCVTLTFLVVTIYLAPINLQYGNSYWHSFVGSNLFFHGLIPLLSMVDFFFDLSTEIRFRYTPLSVLPMLIYGLLYMINIEVKWIPGDLDSQGNMYYDWYFLFNQGDISVLQSILVVVVMLLVSYVVGVLVWVINLMFRHLFFGYQDDEGRELILSKDDSNGENDFRNEEILEDRIIGHVGDEENPTSIHTTRIQPGSNGYDEVEETYTTDTGVIHTVLRKVRTNSSLDSVSRKNRKTYIVPKDKMSEEKERVYHISRYGFSKKWQVRLSNTSKSMKIFDSKEEAIDCAKIMVQTHGGSIRIHSLKGRDENEF